MQRAPAILAFQILASAALATAGRAAERVEVVSEFRSAPLGRDALALAFLERGRLAVLSSDRLALLLLDGPRPALESERALPGPLTPVRRPGGILLVSRADGALWALSSCSAKAVLFAVEGTQLRPQLEAEVLPWPGSARGLRFQRGTNLIEAPDAERSPLLALEPESRALVSNDGELGVPGEPETGIRVGSALAGLWPGWLAASAARPPRGEDTLLLLRRDPGLRVARELPVRGVIRALASHVQAERARLAAALEAANGGTELLVLDLVRSQ